MPGPGRRGPGALGASGQRCGPGLLRVGPGVLRGRVAGSGRRPWARAAAADSATEARGGRLLRTRPEGMGACGRLQALASQGM